MHGQEDAVLVPAYRLEKGQLIELDIGRRKRILDVTHMEDETFVVFMDSSGAGYAYDDRVRVVEEDC